MKKLVAILMFVANILFTGSLFCMGAMAVGCSQETSLAVFTAGSLIHVAFTMVHYHYPSFFPSSGIAWAQPLVTKFKKDVEEKLEPNNTFIEKSVDDAAYLSGKTVRKGVAGDDPEVITNPTQFPLQITENVDDNLDYDISLHATKPQRLSDELELINSFPKRQTVANAHARVLRTKIAMEMLYCWAPTLSTNRVLTSGASVAAALTHKGATGNRKAVTKNDWIDASELLDRMDVDDEDKYALVGSIHYAQLLKIDDFINYEKTGKSDMLAKGIIGEICGIKIFKRSLPAIFSTSYSKKKLDSTILTTDNAGILVWGAGMVNRAIGPVDVYYNPNQGTMLGGTINMAVRAGGAIRKDEKGVVAIIEN